MFEGLSVCCGPEDRAFAVAERTGQLEMMFFILSANVPILVDAQDVQGGVAVVDVPPTSVYKSTILLAFYLYMCMCVTVQCGTVCACDVVHKSVVLCSGGVSAVLFVAVVWCWQSSVTVCLACITSSD